MYMIQQASKLKALIDLFKDKLHLPGYEASLSRFQQQRNRVEVYFEKLQQKEILAPEFQFLAE